MTSDDVNDFRRARPATAHVVRWRGSDVWKAGDTVLLAIVSLGPTKKKLRALERFAWRPWILRC